MPVVTPRAEAVSHSGIREIVHLVAERDDVVRLEIGEPGYRTPSHIVTAGVQAADAGARYTASAGQGDLRAAIADKLRRVNGIHTAPEQVVICNGAVQGCAVALAALVDAGDEVLVPDPAWPNYEMLVTMFGGVPVRYPLRPENEFAPDPDEVARLVGKRTAAIIINTPANPTGAVFPPGVVRALVQVGERTDTTVIADEVYDELIFEGQPANAAIYAPEHVVGVYSFSKTYAMTGWRIGYLTAPGWLAPTLAKLQEPVISSVSQVSQVAALAAITGSQECVAEMRLGYQQRRDLTVDLLRAEGIKSQTPRGAFYLMLPLAAGTDSRSAAIHLVDHGVSVAPGTAFGDVAADHFRLSLASTEADLREGVTRVAQWYRATNGGALLHTNVVGHG